MLADSNARLAAARRLTDRRARRDTGRFLAEGSPAVSRGASGGRARSSSCSRRSRRLRRHAELLAAADVPVYEISSKAAAKLSETVTPQGLVAVCRAVDVPLDEVLARDARLVVVLVDANDPGNAGTIVRTADAAGADAVVFAGRSVDPYNGKAVRATAGSLFHLDIVVDVSPAEAIAAGRAAGLTVLAATGSGADDLDDLADRGALRAPTHVAVRQRGARPAGRGDRGCGSYGAGADPRPRREPEPGRRRGGVPVRQRPRAPRGR